MDKYFRHFKGGIYRLIDIAKDSETKNLVVVYQAMYGDGDIWIRPYDNFFGTVERDGIILDRFKLISTAEALSIIPIELNPCYHFPDIQYQKEMPSLRKPGEGFSKGVKAMITLLRRNDIVSADFFANLHNDDDIEKEALRRICEFKPEDDLESIFHLIQAWGGSSGRGIYIFGRGFNWTELKPEYESLLSTCFQTKTDDEKSISTLVQAVIKFDKSIDHLGVSFITKHVRFLLYRTLKEDTLPIYDSVMAREVMLQTNPSVKQLAEYWKVMTAKAKRLGISLMSLERQIFQHSLLK